MGRKEVILITTGILFTSSILAGCTWFRKQPVNPDRGDPDRFPKSLAEPLSTPTIDSATSTATNTTTPTPSRVTNGMTGAIYKSENDPEFAGKHCLVIGEYTTANKQTVFGAVVALGPDASRYNDIPGPVVVFDASGLKIGEFGTSQMPPSQFSNISPNTIVCDASPISN